MNEAQRLRMLAVSSVQVRHGVSDALLQTDFAGTQMTDELPTYGTITPRNDR